MPASPALNEPNDNTIDFNSEVFVNNLTSAKKTRHSVLLNLDPDVLAFFKGSGKGHITRMQNVLRAYVAASASKPAAND